MGGAALVASFLVGDVAWAASSDAVLATSFFAGAGADKDKCGAAAEWVRAAAEMRSCPSPLSGLPACD